MFKLVLEKAEEPEIILPTSAGSWKKQEYIFWYILDAATTFSWLLGAHSQGLAAGVRPSLVPDPTASLDPQHMIVEQLRVLGFG